MLWTFDYKNSMRIKMVRILYVILAICYIAQLPKSQAVMKIQSKTVNFPGKELVFGYESYEDGKLTYATCNTNDENDERKCNVIREKTAYSDDTYTCNVTLKLSKRLGNSPADTDKISVIPFGNNKAISYRAEKGKNANVKINTINFDDCKVTENEISVTNPMKNPKYAVIITPYKDSYDVIYRNSDMCGPTGRCKVTIDAAGKIIEGPANTTQVPLFLSFYPYVAAIDPKSREKGTFYMEAVNRSFNFVIHKPDGSKKFLVQRKGHMPIVKSVANDFLSVCYKENVTKYNCLQYDKDGNTKFEMDPVSEYNRTDIAIMYNLPNGGLLVLAGKCDKRYCELDQVDMIVIKVDSAGKKVGTLDTGTMKFESGTKNIRAVSSFHIDEDNNYCLSIAKYRSADKQSDTNGTIEASTHCFTDQDFSK